MDRRYYRSVPDYTEREHDRHGAPARDTSDELEQVIASLRASLLPPEPEPDDHDGDHAAPEDDGDDFPRTHAELYEEIEAYLAPRRAIADMQPEVVAIQTAFGPRENINLPLDQYIAMHGTSRQPLHDNQANRPAQHQPFNFRSTVAIRHVTERPSRHHYPTGGLRGRYLRDGQRLNERAQENERDSEWMHDSYDMPHQNSRDIPPPYTSTHSVPPAPSPTPSPEPEAADPEPEQELAPVVDQVEWMRNLLRHCREELDDLRELNAQTEEAHADAVERYRRAEERTRRAEDRTRRLEERYRLLEEHYDQAVDRYEAAAKSNSQNLLLAQRSAESALRLQNILEELLSAGGINTEDSDDDEAKSAGDAYYEWHSCAYVYNLVTMSCRLQCLSVCTMIVQISVGSLVMI
ncbi:hypothetical protein CC85DRAFT_292311 [Cutaneotrichosporon oleaginosum]|uniref:Uncharacterized protein n=2 Tax=Cutaneotrichosporon oleaginosum TaxID=879819 RepID=A0A0J0XM12_9TREE|nr:uncharacterized protein CC85DRAFT_292311 [Cutaneotrichosporon oleaginosum]KLT42098.1 hypothetical protein CC85DRAFT_292311 [Cutaneotrichosporon oleaginosum]